MGPGLRDDSAEGNVMNNTEKSAGMFGGPSAAEKEQLLQQFYGKRLLSSTGAGAGLGLGAAALYHLLRGAKPEGKKEKKYPSYGSGTPMIAKEALDLGNLAQSVGGALPTTMLPFSPGVPGQGPAPSADPYPWRKSWSTAANIGGAALGTYAGAKLVNSIMKAKKKRDNEAALEKARAEYYSALGGKSAAILPHVLGGAGLGAGIGAGVGAYRAEKGQKLRGALQGGAVGAGVGAGAGALASKLVSSGAPTKLLPPPTAGGAVVPAVPPKIPPAAPAGAAVPKPSGVAREGKNVVITTGGQKTTFTPQEMAEWRAARAELKPPVRAGSPSAGRPVMPDPPGWNAPYNPKIQYASSPEGVAFAARSMAKGAAFESAQADYHAALAGEKNALDTAFEAVKQANLLSSATSALLNTPQTLRTAYLLTLLGAGGVGAKYMYDRTKNLTTGENLAKAQASRARTKGLPSVWVDPESLAHIKSTAESDE